MSQQQLPEEVDLRLPRATIEAALIALSKFPYEQAAQHIDVFRARISAALEPQQATTQETNS